MTEKQKAKIVVETLDEFFPQPAIPLNHKDPYTLLISVLLSAQTTDVMVNRVTPTLFAKAATPEKMVKLGEQAVREIIKPIGLAPTKARNIIKLSQMLVEKHGAKVPANFAELEALPGVGHKSASVVMAQAFGKPAFPVDTHIHRLAYRWGISSGKSVEQTERVLKRIFPEDEWIKLHLQIIYFGRAYCPARNHDPRQCPLCSRVGRKELFE